MFNSFIFRTRERESYCNNQRAEGARHRKHDWGDRWRPRVAATRNGQRREPCGGKLHRGNAGRVPRFKSYFTSTVGYKAGGVLARKGLNLVCRGATYACTTHLVPATFSAST